MKFLIVLFLAVNLVQAAEKCSERTAAKFELCELKDYLSQTIKKVYPTMKQVSSKKYAKLLEKTGVFAIDKKGEILSLIPLLGLEESFQEWKEVKMGKLVWKERVYAIKHIRSGMKECGLSQPNSALLMKRLHKNKNTAAVECLEAESIKAKEKNKARKASDKKRKEAREYLKAYDCRGLSTEFEKRDCHIYSEV